MALLSDNLWEKKYNFNELDVGESLEVTGIEGNIRSAASMWGTRYGIWLQVTKIDDGRMRVTRMEAPLQPRLKRMHRIERIEQRLDAMTNLLRLILEKLNGHDTNKPS